MTSITLVFLSDALFDDLSKKWQIFAVWSETKLSKGFMVPKIASLGFYHWLPAKNSAMKNGNSFSSNLSEMSQLFRKIARNLMKYNVILRYALLALTGCVHVNKTNQASSLLIESSCLTIYSMHILISFSAWNAPQKPTM